MRGRKEILMMMLVVLFCSIIFAQTEIKEEEAIKEIILISYVDGLQNSGDFEKIDKGFHKDFNLLGINKNNGTMWKYPISKWKESVSKKLKKGELPRKENEKVSIKFISVDVTNNAAVVKLQFFIGQKLTYTDYISLYKFGKNWKIVSKIYTEM